MLNLITAEIRKLLSRKFLLIITVVLSIMLFVRFFIYCRDLKLFENRDYQKIRAEYQYSEGERDVEQLAEKHSIPAEEIVGIFLILDSQYEYIDQYKDFIDGIPKRADNLRQAVIFSGEKSYAYRSIDKCLNDYAGLKPVTIIPDMDTGIQALSEYDWSYLFVAVVLLMACAILLKDEEDDGILGLAQTTKNGKIPLALIKWVTIILFGSFLSGGIACGRIIIAHYVLGLGDIDRSLQSISSFRNCYFNISVRQWLACIVLFAILVSVVLGTVSLALLTLLKRIAISVAPIAAGIGMGLVFYMTIPINAKMNSLKFINLCALADVGNLFSVYSNVDLFGYPVSVLPTLFVYAGVLFALALSIYLLSFSGVLVVSLPRWRIQRKLRIRGTVSVFSHELYRFLIPGIGTLTLVGYLVFSLNQLDYGKLKLTQRDYIYYTICQDLRGEVGEETLQKLSELEQIYSAQMHQDMDRIYYRDAMEQVTKELNLLLSAKDRGVAVHYISEVVTKGVFESSHHFLLFGFLLAGVLSLSAAPLFSEDWDTGLSGLVRTTKRGRHSVFLCRYSVIFLMYSIGFFGYMIPYIVNWIHRTHLQEWSVPLQSVVGFSMCKGNMSIRGFMILWLCAAWLSGLIYPIVLSALSGVVRKKGTTLTAASAIMAVDFLCSILNFPVLRSIGVSGTYGLMRIVQETGSVAIVYISLIKNVIIFAVIIMLHYKKYSE